MAVKSFNQCSNFISSQCGKETTWGFCDECVTKTKHTLKILEENARARNLYMVQKCRLENKKNDQLIIN